MLKNSLRNLPAAVVIFERTRRIKNTRLFEVQIQALVNLTKQICNSGSQPSISLSTLELCLEVGDGKQQKKE